MGEDNSILQVGGLSGLLAGLVMVIFMIVVVAAGGAATAEDTLIIAQELRAPFVILHIGTLIGFLLPGFLFLALRRILTDAGPARALLGAAFGVSGALIFAANWAIVVTSFPALSDLHAAPGADQPMIVIAAEVVEQITHSFQFLGVLLIGLAFVSFGWGMVTHPTLPNGYGWGSAILGGIAGAHGLLAFSGDDITLAAVAFLGVAALFLVLGWKVYSLSRATVR